MNITRFEVLGFRSYHKLATFDFTAQPGLVRLSGDNGDGKSSFFKAICWCLYGKSDDGLLAPQLATWESGAGIYACCHINGRRVMRSWNANKLTIDGADATQDEVNEVVGLTLDQFLHSRYFAQKQRSFLDLTATEQTDLLASILDLDVWIGYANKADESRKAAEKLVDRLSGRLDADTASLHALKHEDLESERKAWADNRQSTRKQLQAKIDELAAAVKTAQNASGTAHKALERASSTQHTSDDRKSLVEADLRVAQERLADAKASSRQLTEQLAESRKGNCPTCGQAWPHKGEHKVTKQAVEHAARFARACAADVDAHFDRLDVIRKQEKADRAKLEALKDDAHAQANLLAQFEIALKEKRTALRRHDSEDNPWDQIILDRQALIKEREAALAELLAQVHENEKRVIQFGYWAKAFKDVRLFLVAEALTHLEVEVNSSLSALGLPDWEIRFAPDSTTKKGDIRRGFSTTILSPANPGPVPWNVWSGGETQRLRNACTMGIANLITSYTGAPSFVEVWDEPTNGMTQEGIDALLECLRDRALHQGKQVWIVDHRSLSSGVFNESVTAVKIGTASTLERNDVSTEGE